MTLLRIKLGLAVFASLSVVLIFLLPAATGPFPVVHGPATALRSKAAAVAVLLAISLARVLVSYVGPVFVTWNWREPRLPAGISHQSPALEMSELRC